MCVGLVNACLNNVFLHQSLSAACKFKWNDNQTYNTYYYTDCRSPQPRISPFCIILLLYNSHLRSSCCTNLPGTRTAGTPPEVSWCPLQSTASAGHTLCTDIGNFWRTQADISSHNACTMSGLYYSIYSLHTQI